jgi:hypothetical protein
MSNIDWGAVIGGSLIAGGSMLCLLAFGGAAGVSFSLLSSGRGSTLLLASAAWVSAAMILSNTAGGYFVGRYRRPGIDWTNKARETNDGAHGVLMWAVLWCLLGFVACGALFGAAKGAVSNYLKPVSQLSGRATAGVLLRQSVKEIEDPRSAAGELIADFISRGSISSEDRDYLSSIIATEARISDLVAKQRIDAALDQAKQTSVKVRTMVAWLVFVAAAVSVLAGGAAYWSAAVGGSHRDEVLSRAEPPQPPPPAIKEKSVGANDRRGGKRRREP